MSNRRANSEQVVAPARERTFRLRHLLLLACMVGLGLWTYPRVRAAFELHTLATAAANYGACMVGPTGPALMRDNPTEFVTLVRRRLVASEGDSFPFAECATLAKTVSGSHEVARAHNVRAGEFVEYGSPKGQAHFSLSQLYFRLDPLSALAKQAWPIERRGYTHLVVASTHAKEAAHPVAPTPAAVGSGLPGWAATYRAAWKRGHRRFLAVGHSSNLSVFASSDGGIRWSPQSLSQPGLAEHAGRCVTQDAQQAFTLELQEGGLLVQSLALDHVVKTTLIDSASDVLAASCDQTALLLLAKRESSKELIVCAHGGPCGRVAHKPEWFDGHFDIARVHGTSIVATARAGIVRVRSSRDEGRSWTPDHVAFDWASQPLPSHVKVPSKLLAVGEELWLYGAAERGQTYPVLFSADMGASWHTPRPVERAPNASNAIRQ